MKIYLAAFLSFLCAFSQAQNTHVKWATQETFFEDLVGKSLPEFNGIKPNKQIFNSVSLNNQVLVINFWFENCPPCIAEMPELNKLVETYGEKGVRFIGITHDVPKAARRFQKRNHYQYEIISLTKDQIAKLNINHGFPSNVLVGKDGKIIYAMSNISFSDPDYKEKSILFEEKLKTAL